ncbi:hypothetical protein M2140_000243 [Clostridiales Family XIII bacterium PM5-7]
MERGVRLIGALKWLSLPLGYVMYLFTVDSFGDITAGLLSVAAMISFWMLVRNQETTMIGETIVRDIKEAISETGNVDNFVEIKRLKNGIVARVYLINAKQRAAVIHKAITRKIDGNAYKKYLWVMQLTDMPERGALKETQKLLNDQLLDELMRKRKGDK